jgi:hypothetical protein
VLRVLFMCNFLGPLFFDWGKTFIQVWMQVLCQTEEGSMTGPAAFRSGRNLKGLRQKTFAGASRDWMQGNREVFTAIELFYANCSRAIRDDRSRQ